MATKHEYNALRFFGIVIGISWTCWVISALLATEKSREGIAFLFNALGLFAPMVAAFFVIYRSGNPALKADFKDRLFNLRLFSPKHLLATLFLPPLVMVMALGLSLHFGQTTEQFKLSGPIDQLLPLILLAFVLAPTIEEIGWRGYGTDSLRARMGVLKTALLFGVLWSAWHAPLVFIKGTYHYELAHMDSVVPLVNFFVSVVAAGILVTWLYYRHNRSILAGILLHSVMNASAILPDATQDTKAIATVLYVIVSIVIVLADRDLFREGPRTFVGAK